MVDESLEQATETKDSGKLLLTEEEWTARRNSGKAASSSHGGDGKRCGKASLEQKKQVDPNAAGAVGRWAIGHGSAQIVSMRRRLRLIWRKLMMTMRPLS